MQINLIFSIFLFYIRLSGTFALENNYDSFELTSTELRAVDLNIHNAEDSEDIGRFMNDFFYDSKSQLILDLDIFRELWLEIDKYRSSAASGDIDYIQVFLL